VLELSQTYDLLVTLEENAIAGGAGAGVNELLATQGETTATLNLGLPDAFVEHGAHADQLIWTGLDSDGIVQRINSKYGLIQQPIAPSLSFHDTMEATLKSK
ncbi:unnamed protein product, partial [marine sediment metagenome]